MTYHVLTPMSRYYNLIELGNAIKCEGAHWHLLCIEGEPKLPDLGHWTHQYFFKPPPSDFFVGHWLVNQFLDNTAVHDEDRYVVLTDDDFLEPGLFKKLDQFGDDILIVSMRRSNMPTGTDPNCPFGTLVAHPDNIKVAHVGFEQLIIKGKILKQYRCGGVYHADGLLIMKLYEDLMERFRFVPEAYVYYNYLPPGRYGRWDR